MALCSGDGAGGLVLNGRADTRLFVCGAGRHNTNVLRDGCWRLRGQNVLVIQGCRRVLLTENILGQNEKTGLVTPAIP